MCATGYQHCRGQGCRKRCKSFDNSRAHGPPPRETIVESKTVNHGRVKALLAGRPDEATFIVSMSPRDPLAKKCAIVETLRPPAEFGLATNL